MTRWIFGAVAALMLLAGTAAGQVCAEDLGVSVTGGMMQLGGGDEEYGDSGLMLGLEVRKLLTNNVCLSVEYRRGMTESGDEPETAEAEKFYTWGESDNFRTIWNYAGASAMYNFTPDARVSPYLSGGLGMTFWEVQDWREEASEEGEVPEGYNTDGKLEKLSGASLTGVVGAGLELFATDRLSFTVGARYYLLLQSETDNVGWSAAHGPDFVDANNSILEAHAGITYYFGAGDCDGDGIVGKDDECWNIPEDFDGFEDEDGCPEADNDLDGIMDEDDLCPDEPEDFDGFEDEDGCPDVDRDGDGIFDDEDQCPDEPEDHDAYMDEDGCPDLDNDGDGVPDTSDKCPDTPKGTEVDEHGCPMPKVTLVAVMVNFDLDSSELDKEARARLDKLAEALLEDEEYVIDIAGHACDLGTDSYNESLSMRRANTVKEYLLDKGVAEERITVKAYGEEEPLVPNNTEEQRRVNRRVSISPSRPRKGMR
ncbi:MAG: OmpA family protein [Candidatus Eisenbacteria bacterium]|nr:OmpA family protein [Candidatus Eisenbacteria bacterium]